MLLIIHNLPSNIRLNDVKSLIQEKCGLDEVILDNLISEGQFKRVTVGLADEEDAALLVRKINGLYINGVQLYVRDVRRKLSEQPYQPENNPHVLQPRPQKKSHTSQYTAPEPDPIPPQMPPSMMPVPLAYNNLPFYMSPVQSTYANYENQMLLASNQLPQNSYYQQPTYEPQGPQESQNQWNQQSFASYPEKTTQASNNDRKTSKDDEWERRQGTRYSSKQEDESQWRDFRTESKSSRKDGSYRRSPDRNRERSDNKNSQSNKSRRNESDDRFRRDRTPPRGRNDDYMKQKRPSRNDYDRSPPAGRFAGRNRRDGYDKREENRDFEDRERDYGRNDKRHVDHRDQEREQRRGPDRFEKPRDYDQHNEPDDYNQREFRNKRPYSDVSQSSKTYGNEPKNSTFGMSNTNVFDKQSKNAHDDNNFRSKENTLGGFDRNSSPKRLRLGQDKEKVMPSKIDLKSKPGAHLEPPQIKPLPLRKIVVRHTNWRYQIAAQVGKEIIAKATPDPLPNYGSVFKKLKECIVARIDVILGDSLATSLADMYKRYRAKFGPSDDQNFFEAVVDKLKRDEKDSSGKLTGDQKNKPNTEVNKNVADKPQQAAGTPGLLPPPGASNNPRPGAPQFQNRTPTINPRFQNRAPTPAPQFQNRAPTSTPQLQNRAPTPQFQNRAPTSTPQFQNRTPATTPKFQNRAPTAGPQFQSRALIATPPFQSRAPTATPQFQNRAPTSTPQVRNTAPQFRIPLLSQSQNKASTSTVQNVLPGGITKSATKKLLKNPQTKKAVSQQKKIHKLEFQEEDLYAVDPVVKNAIDAEVTELVKVYTTKGNKKMDQAEEILYNKLVNETTPVFRKVVKLHLTKRVMNISTGLVVRVFPEPKWPNHAALDAFLRKHGVISHKKCPKMYVAVCGSFPAYDKLLAMATARIGDTSVSFKPMHIAGPRKSVREKLRENKFRKNVMQVAGLEGLMFDDGDDINDSDLEDLGGDDIGGDDMVGDTGGDDTGRDDMGEDDTGGDDIGNADADNEQGNDDVVLIEQSKDNVVVIEDDGDTDLNKTNTNDKETDQNEPNDNPTDNTETTDNKDVECIQTVEDTDQSEINDENKQSLEVMENIVDDDLEDF